MSDAPKRFGVTRFRLKFASPDNPIREGFFVREFSRDGKLNPGLFYELTDGNGRFWEASPDFLERLP